MQYRQRLIFSSIFLIRAATIRQQTASFVHMKRIACLLLILLTACLGFSQGLEHVPPVLLGKTNHPIDTGVSFVLTPNNIIEIIDADQPWPPRWFVDGGQDLTKEQKDAGTIRKSNYRDARFQNGYFTYCQLRAFKFMDLEEVQSAYIICNSKMETIDTVIGVDLPLNPHDFKINWRGERLYAAMLDTVLDISKMSGNPADTAMKAMVDVLEVLDSNDNLLFRWNPVSALGVEALYYPYGGLVSRLSKPGFLDWSHCNGVDWDFDGNILFCFRHIGVGKVSRKDGAVMWQVDRKNMPYMVGNDSLSFYLQHGFQKVSDNPLYNTYSLYSNGDSLHQPCYGLQFNVSKNDYHISGVPKKWPLQPVALAIEGNYDINVNGEYLMDYGIYAYVADSADNSGYKPFFEYGIKSGQVFAQYKIPIDYSSYKVTQLEGCKPPRPKIGRKGAELKASGVMRQWVWYQLSGTDDTKAEKVGAGACYKPTRTGLYCVAGKYGIGWTVSKPFLFK